MAKVLLADDDAAVRDLVRRALTGDGHEVEATHDGAEALDAFVAKAGGIDILVTDVDMPGLDGISLVQEVRRRDAAIGIVLMSGHSDQLDRAKALSPARLVSIAKPFTLDEIKKAVRSLT